jgi:hypothetical protein
LSFAFACSLFNLPSDDWISAAAAAATHIIIMMIIITNGSPFSKQEDEKGFITTDGGGGTVMGELGSPESLPEMERPPLRKIDMYIRPDCPCCSMTKRYTVAFLASIGKLSLHDVLLQASFQISNSPAE